MTKEEATEIKRIRVYEDGTYSDVTKHWHSLYPNQIFTMGPENNGRLLVFQAMQALKENTVTHPEWRK